MWSELIIPSSCVCVWWCGAGEVEVGEGMGIGNALTHFVLQELHSHPPEAMLRLVSTKGRNLWAGPASKVHDSQNSCQIWKILLNQNTKQILYTCSENRIQPEVAILCAGQRERGLWGLECRSWCEVPAPMTDQDPLNCLSQA